MRVKFEKKVVGGHHRLHVWWRWSFGHGCAGVRSCAWCAVLHVRGVRQPVCMNNYFVSGPILCIHNISNILTLREEQIRKNIPQPGNVPLLIITNLFQQPTATMPERRHATFQSWPSGFQPHPRITKSSSLTLTDLAARLEEMEEKYEKMATKVWILEEHILFLDDELKRLRAGEPSRRLPTQEWNLGEFDDPRLLSIADSGVVEKS